ncbi:hypothetical protein IEQ34_019844 [Dendrobium chrysotoxum]|uniref:Uncharacterized protein n=1 Tax=Dendrobium chrysotoxum TaxID=161865 RepID=A0AAV7G8S1_DENCH|nr:hypothetical protein IEQ34_019844 [Dendrobium chrysotoxum]
MLGEWRRRAREDLVAASKRYAASCLAAEELSAVLGNRPLQGFFLLPLIARRWRLEGNGIASKWFEEQELCMFLRNHGLPLLRRKRRLSASDGDIACTSVPPSFQLTEAELEKYRKTT